MLLIIANMAAIILPFVVAAILMDWMNNTFGYVRLLGMAHLVAWTPAFVYVPRCRKELSFSCSR